MSNKAARNLFIYGSLFFFMIFLGLTFDTMGKLDSRAPVITDQVNMDRHTGYADRGTHLSCANVPAG